MNPETNKLEKVMTVNQSRELQKLEKKAAKAQAQDKLSTTQVLKRTARALRKFTDGEIEFEAKRRGIIKE